MEGTDETPLVKAVIRHGEVPLHERDPPYDDIAFQGLCPWGGIGTTLLGKRPTKLDDWKWTRMMLSRSCGRAQRDPYRGFSLLTHQLVSRFPHTFPLGLLHFTVHGVNRCVSMQVAPGAFSPYA